MLFWLKVILSGAVIATASALTKRVPWLGGMLVALPLVSLLTLIWVYIESNDVKQISALSWSIFWYVLPTLGFFVLLPTLLKTGLSFWMSLGISSAVLILVFSGYRNLLKMFGVEI